MLARGIEQPTFNLCCREYQRSIKESVFKLLCDQIALLNMGYYYQVQATDIKGYNGTKFAFEGLYQNVQNIKSMEGVDIAWAEEAANISQKSWEVLIPTIRKANSEIWVSFNPQFEDDPTMEFVDHPRTDSLVIKTSYRDNPWWNNILEQERLDHQLRDPDTYAHVWEGECIQWMEGAIYANQLREAYADERVTQVDWDENVPVFTVWDIGRTDDTAIIWYQVIQGEIHILEAYASSEGTLDEYAEQILGRKCQIDIVGHKNDSEIKVTLGDEIEELAYRTKYKYSMHWLPHDARAKTLQAKGKSTIEQLAKALGIQFLSIVPDVGLEDGIMQARQTFKRCWFDSEGCAEFLRALRNYRRELARDEKSLQRKPKHDWSSHMADAFRYLSIAWQHEAPPPAITEKPKDIQTATLEELWPVSQQTSTRI